MVTVKISRLHFKGGRAIAGGAVRTGGNLTLDSCIFSDNQTSGNPSKGGAVYIAQEYDYVPISVTLRGCTFYNNTASQGGAVFHGGGTIILTGNLFYGNTASVSGNAVYGVTKPTTTIVALATSGGYNVSDAAAGIGYTGAAGDLFDITDISFATPGDPATKPGSGSNLKTLTGTLPTDFPTVYFNGGARSLPATAGAVSAD